MHGRALMSEETGCLEQRQPDTQLAGLRSQTTLSHRNAKSLMELSRKRQDEAKPPFPSVSPAIPALTCVKSAFGALIP